MSFLVHIIKGNLFQPIFFQFLIDELKKTVPVWKKEYYKNNSVWVNAPPEKI